jgi:hypothetical protein
MAGTYGEPGKNTFAVKGVSGILSPVVNAETGVTQIYKQGAFNTFQSLGTYNPATKKFTGSTNLNQTELKALSSESGLANIKNAAEITSKKAQTDAGVSSAAADAKTKELLNTGKASIPTETGDNSAPLDLGTTVAESDKTRNQFPSLRYPGDIGSTKQDVIKFTMLKYEPKKFSGGSDLGSFSQRDSNRNGIGSVILPIPSGISDTNAVQWGSENMNAAVAAAANIAMDGIIGGMSKAADTTGKLASEISENSGEVKTGIAGLFASAAVGTDPGQLLSRTQGAVLNPNMELLFQGPSLRPFSFSFKMSARSKEEAKQIIGIIRFFKQGMSPIKSASNLFLKAPHTFKIQYLHLGANGKDHPYIGKIKECALQNLTINYTPEGQYATFYDGMLVSYEMQMTFQELEPVFNEDYGKGSSSSGPDSEIGF